MHRYYADPDYGEYLEDVRERAVEAEAQRLNTPRPGERFAPADFAYDPLARKGFE